jgi:hypothetical protein
MDSSGPTQTATANLSLTVLVGPLTITTTSLTAGSHGSPYIASLAAANGNAPYRWKLTSGKLPKGLKLNKLAGAITGTPGKTSVSSTFTVEVFDAKVGKPKTQNTATATFTITIS